MARIDGRQNDEHRFISFEPDYIIHPKGSALAVCGNTKVICSATVEERVPPFIAGTGKGWLTAEYSMLPASTNTRNQRDIGKLKQNSRSVEIQRLIGRSLRAAIDFEMLGERTITIDCDVLQADGGTRTTSINGGYVALYIACEKLVKEGLIPKNPVVKQIAAISAGIVGGKAMADLCYEEDSRADVDFNIIMDMEEKFVELQGTGENNTFSMAELNDILRLGKDACLSIMEIQNKILGIG